MRRILNCLPIILVTLSLPALAAQAESPKPIIRIIRSGKGQARVRDASAARTASPDQAGGTVRRPYKAAKPGEGAPKN